MKAILCLVLCAGTAFAGEPDPDVIARKAQDLIYRAYMRADVQRYCTDNPDSLYPVEIGELAIVVRCTAWNDWHEALGPQ